jgi:hypothetical protein
MASISWEEFIAADLAGGACSVESHSVIYRGIIKNNALRFGGTPYIMIEFGWNDWQHTDPRDDWEEVVEMPHPCCIIGLFDRLYKKTETAFGWTSRPIGFA